MKRLALVLLVIASLVFPAAQAALAQACSTPPPTYTPTAGYRATVENSSAANLLVYYPLDETSGTTAHDRSGNGADGTYSGVTLNATTFLNGDPAPSFDGVNDDVDIYTTYLASNFNGSEGSALLWVQIPSGWADGVEHRFLILNVSSLNRVLILRPTTANEVDLRYSSGGVNRFLTKTSFSPTSWFSLLLTWSHSADQVKAYVNGVQIGSTLTGLGTWSGVLSSSFSVIGAGATTGSNPTFGNIAQSALWSSALDATQAAVLATVPAYVTEPPTATVCPTYTPTPTFTYTPSDTPTETFTPTYTLTPTLTPSDTPTETYTPSNTVPPGAETLTEIFYLTNTRTPTPTPTFTFTPTETFTPTDTLTPTETFTPSDTPTITPTANLYTYLTVIPPGGTEADAHVAALVWQVTAGQALIALLVTALLIIALFDKMLRARGRQ